MGSIAEPTAESGINLTLLSTSSPTRPEPEREPQPEWIKATKLWGDAWPAHWIGLSVVFFVLAVITIFTLISIVRQKRRKLGILKFSITILVILFVFSLSRSLYLFINPYESTTCIFSRNKCPLFLSRFLFSLALPSLLSAFLLLYLALTEVTKIKGRGIERLQNWKFLCGVVSLSYVLSVVIDLVVAYYASTFYLVTLCQGYFILLSLLLVCAYLHAGINIMRETRLNRQELKKVIRNQEPSNTPKPPDLTKVIVLTFVTSALGLTFLGCQLYALAAVFIKDSQILTNVDPWPWYGYQTVYRIDEFLMGCLLYFTVTYKASPKGTDTKDGSSRSSRFSSFSRGFKGKFRSGRKETLKTEVTTSLTVELVHKETLNSQKQDESVVTRPHGQGADTVV